MRRKPRFLLFKVVSVSHTVEIRSTPKLLCRAILPYLTPRIPHKIVSTPSKDLKHLFTDSLQKGMPCFQSWAFTPCSFGQDASPTMVMHVVMFLGVVKERSRTLVWLGIEFIPLQTSEYIQRTTKTYILKNSRRFKNLQLDHSIGLIFQHLENLDHFELRGRRSEKKWEYFLYVKESLFSDVLDILTSPYTHCSMLKHLTRNNGNRAAGNVVSSQYLSSDEKE